MTLTVNNEAVRGESEFVECGPSNMKKVVVDHIEQGTGKILAESDIFYGYSVSMVQQFDILPKEIPGYKMVKAPNIDANKDFVDNGRNYTFEYVKDGSSTDPEEPDVGGWRKDSTGWWYKNADGTYPKACWKQNAGEWYYFNSSGYRVGGWQKIKNKWYYFDLSTGIMSADEWIDDIYYVTGSGAMATGWLELEEGWYYLNSSGKKLTGWQKSGSKWYFLDKVTGIMHAGEWIYDTYYVTGSGAMATGWLKMDGKWYYLNSSGKKLTGWQIINNIWYYLDPTTGIMYENQWLEDTYYLKTGGAMATGWLLIGEDYYYFNPNGKKVTSRWVGNYYLKADGTMARAEWVDQEKYYVDENGKWVPGKTR